MIAITSRNRKVEDAMNSKVEHLPQDTRTSNDTSRHNTPYSEVSAPGRQDNSLASYDLAKDSFDQAFSLQDTEQESRANRTTCDDVKKTSALNKNRGSPVVPVRTNKLENKDTTNLNKPTAPKQEIKNKEIKMLI